MIRVIRRYPGGAGLPTASGFTGLFLPVFMHFILSGALFDKVHPENMKAG